MQKGKLYLIPAPISSNSMDSILLQKDIPIVSSLSFFISETPKVARSFLKDLPLTKKIQEIEIYEFNEHSKDIDISDLLVPLMEGNDMGLISDAGIPSVADPGFRIVRKAQEMGIEVCPFVGPSSILLALMSSGLNGQSFAFNGYLQKEKDGKREDIKYLENLSYQRRQTQIFMEPPYRNQSMLEDILSVCEGYTLLCIAYDIMGEDQKIVTKRVEQWRREKISLEKKPCLF